MEAISAHPLSEDGQALLLLAFVLARSGRHMQARNVLEGLREMEPTSVEVLPLLTQCCLELGLFDAALELALELQGQCTAADALCAARLTAEALWALGRKDEARALLAKVVEEMSDAVADA